ncbi:MAG TPA: YtxH domain-containing protein [Candidatus Binatia bacterium]|nr:YtxH domain-containing protein [Candidatus Binatia bacterium]
MAEQRGSDSTAGYLGWFFLGGLAGAAAALLLTPKTGRETRDLLAEQGAELLKKAQEATGTAQDRTGDVLEKGRDYVQEQADRLRSAFDAGRSAMREEMDRGESA